jgi:hypothetical protein
MANKTVTINGMVYDSKTGMPLRVERGSESVHHHNAGSVHSPLQKSKTLNRRFVGSNPHAATNPHAISTHKKVTPTPVVSRSESVSKFAQEFNARHSKHRNNAVVQDVAPVMSSVHHPLVNKVEQRTQKPAATQTYVKPSQVIKHESIANALEHAKPVNTTKQHKPAQQAKMTRAFSFASASFALLLLGGYFTYLNMPSISTRVAAAQAGINAEYPGYHPTGYSLSGPVAYNQGNVSMKFAANASPQSYTLVQSRSGWDSSAVLDNYVAPKAGDQYSTTTSNGLTIYTFGSNAAWVNGGILYTIDGNAPLSSDQIQRIATSL